MGRTAGSTATADRTECGSADAVAAAVYAASFTAGSTATADYAECRTAGFFDAGRTEKECGLL